MSGDIGNGRSIDPGLRLSSLESGGIPRVVEPIGDPRDAGRLLAERPELLRDALQDCGAVLLRGFPVADADAYRALLASLGLGDLQRYLGAGVRHQVIDKIYTSSDARDIMRIPLHQELSYTQYPPAFVSFFCECAPASGTGHTLLGRARAITEALPDEVIRFFEGRQVEYISCFPRRRGPVVGLTNPAHKTWSEAYCSSDREDVERLCQRNQQRFEWRGDWLITYDLSDAFKDGLWHNQVHVHRMTPRLLTGWLGYSLYRLLYWRPGTMMMDARMADGSPIPRALIESIMDVLEAHTLAFDWQAGDVLILDNLQVLHGRSKVRGKRRILAAMID